MLTTTSSDPIALDAEHVLQVYRRAPVVFESGKGCALFTKSGERYLDLISGVGVVSLGHGHPGLARAIADRHSIQFVFHVCSYLALIGLVTALLPNLGTPRVPRRSRT